MFFFFGIGIRGEMLLENERNSGIILNDMIFYMYAFIFIFIFIYIYIYI